MNEDISVFLAVCEAGSFAAAAPKLSLTASAVAKSISRIESRLDLRLFQRTTRRLTLSLEGEIYRKACLVASSEMSRVESQLASFRKESAGLVRMSLPPLLGSEVIAPALFDLTKQWKSLSFAISTGVERIDFADGTIDLAVRVGTLPDLTGIKARKLGIQRLVLCCSKSYLKGRKIPKTREDLKEHGLIGSSKDGRASVWSFRGESGEIESFLPKTDLLLEGSLLTRSAIRLNQGIGLLPEWLVREELENGEFVPILYEQIAGHMPVHILWRESPLELPRVRVVIDAIANGCSEMFKS